MRNFAAKIKNLLFMSQKQKLKSERGRLNEGIKDMFMTMDPKAFRNAVEELAKLRDSDKKGFNLVLDEFEAHKNDKPEDHYFGNILIQKIIPGNEKRNVIVKELLAMLWTDKERFFGGYFWRMMPRKKANESDEQFDIRRKRMEDNLMQVMLDVLDDCDYYIKGTQK